MEPLIPTEKLYIKDPPNANDEILAFAEALDAQGKRPWFEVHYPKPDGMDDVTFRVLNNNSFDAVEVKDGVIETLPPYSELAQLGGGS